MEPANVMTEYVIIYISSGNNVPFEIKTKKFPNLQ